MQTTAKLGRIGLLVWVGLSLNAIAKPTPDASIGEKLPDIEEVLRRAGWTMTPEMSAGYSQPGDIFDENNALLKNGTDCFDAPVKEGAYASMEVNRSLQAGVRMQVLVAGAKAGMGVEKKLVFDTPTHRQIPRLDLTPNEACLKTLQRARDQGQDISSWYVITEALSAVIQKQVCGSYSVETGGFVVSGNAEVQQLCEQTSIEPVAVAFKTRPAIELFPIATPDSRPEVLPTQTTTESAPTVAANRSTAGTEICIARKTGFAGSAVPVKLRLDGNPVAKIRNRSVLCVRTTSGAHQVHAQGAGMSGSINVKVQRGHSLKLDMAWAGGLLSPKIELFKISEAVFSERYSNLRLSRQ